MTEFGKLIKHARLEREMGLREAARQLGVSPTYLSQIENGKVPPPSSDVLRRLSALYRVAMDQLLEHAREREPQVVADAIGGDRVMAALLREVCDLDADGRAAALRSILKEHTKLTDDEIDDKIRKLRTEFKRLRRGREGLFAANVVPRHLSRASIEQFSERFLASMGITRAAREGRRDEGSVTMCDPTLRKPASPAAQPPPSALAHPFCSLTISEVEEWRATHPPDRRASHSDAFGLLMSACWAAGQDGARLSEIAGDVMRRTAEAEAGKGARP